MSGETNSDFSKFQSKAVSILELSFFTQFALGIIGLSLYLAVLPHSVQNVLPLVLIIFLAAFSWIMRTKTTQSTPEELKVFIFQWLIISIISIIATVVIVLMFPYSTI